MVVSPFSGECLPSVNSVNELTEKRGVVSHGATNLNRVVLIENTLACHRHRDRFATQRTTRPAARDLTQMAVADSDRVR